MLNYTYRIDVRPSQYGTGWDLISHHTDGATRLTNYAFRATAAASARRIAKQRVSKQGTNLRLEVAIYDRRMNLVRLNQYGRDPRSRS